MSVRVLRLLLKYLQISGYLQRRWVWSDVDGKADGSKMSLFRAFFMDEPMNRDISRNLSRKNTKP